MAEKEGNFPPYKRVSVDDLIPYANNSRTHSDDQIGQIVRSIKEFGFTNPVLVDGENGVIAGHGRLMAAERMGLQEVPAIELSHLSEAQKRAYVIADNKLALNAGWNDDVLKLEIESLGNQDFDLSLTGFSLDELSKLFDETGGVSVDDGIPEVEKDELIVKFNPSSRVEVMNAVSEAVSGIAGASIWCDEQV